MYRIRYFEATDHKWKSCIKVNNLNQFSFYNIQTQKTMISEDVNDVNIICNYVTVIDKLNSPL